MKNIEHGRLSFRPAFLSGWVATQKWVSAFWTVSPFLKRDFKMYIFIGWVFIFAGLAIYLLVTIESEPAFLFFVE